MFIVAQVGGVQSFSGVYAVMFLLHAALINLNIVWKVISSGLCSRQMTLSLLFLPSWTVIPAL